MESAFVSSKKCKKIEDECDAAQPEVIESMISGQQPYSEKPKAF